MVKVERIVLGGQARWHLVDDKGRIHSAPLADRERAERQATEMNRKLERIRRSR